MAPADAACPISFDAPWYAPYQALISCCGHPQSGADWLGGLRRQARRQGLLSGGGRPVEFVDQDLLGPAAGAQAYERRAYEQGQVAVRCEGPGAWHDYFNALVWLAFPKLKARLNALQAEAAMREGACPSGSRGRLRDAVTLFDESGGLWLTSDEDLVEMLRAAQWRRLFVDDRERVQRSARLIVIGHAVLDKLRAPYKSICVHARPVMGEVAIAGAQDPGRTDEERTGRGCIDALASRRLDAAVFSAGRGLPLPVLGMPGWWSDNRCPEFYQDRAVFRQPGISAPRIARS